LLTVAHLFCRRASHLIPTSVMLARAALEGARDEWPGCLTNDRFKITGFASRTNRERRISTR